MIGGSTEAVLQRKTNYIINEIGERVPTWEDVQRLRGWLDLQAGEAKYTYNTKLQESTHIFVCDYRLVTTQVDNVRMVIDGNVYDVLLIDDPMGLHKQLEIYLKYVGR